MTQITIDNTAYFKEGDAIQYNGRFWCRKIVGADPEGCCITISRRLFWPSVRCWVCLKIKRFIKWVDYWFGLTPGGHKFWWIDNFEEIEK